MIFGTWLFAILLVPPYSKMNMKARICYFCLSHQLNSSLWCNCIFSHLFSLQLLMHKVTARLSSFVLRALSWFAVGCYYYCIKKYDQSRRYFRYLLFTLKLEFWVDGCLFIFLPSEFVSHIWTSILEFIGMTYSLYLLSFVTFFHIYIYRYTHFP